MSRRNKIIIVVIAVIVILLVLGLIWWFWLRLPKEEPITNTNQGLQLPEDVVRPLGNVNVSPAQAKLEAELKAVAMTFAERFGSYSSEGGFSNLDDLKDLMTLRMKAWTENYKIEKSGASGEYYGVTTQALTAEIISLDEDFGQAEILVNTQRREMRQKTINPDIFYQKLKLKLVKSQTGWKIDSAEWQ
ncbi:MAG TPA: hypothetical protein VJG65_03780 [Patescibacteria group bacterium]|nr:hypothetical protein [Patescibacteria group bacterium]